MDSYIGIDVGGTFVRMGYLENGGVLDIIKLRSDEVFSRGAKGLVAAAADYAANYAPRAVGVGVPGTVSRDGETVLNVPNVPPLCGFAMKAELSAALGTRVFVENDITMLLGGDIERLGLGAGLIFGCYIGTGLGGSVMQNGKLLRGCSGLCEPGHIPLYGLDRPCSCGKTGCAEQYVSGGALEKLRAEKYPDTDISELFGIMDDAEIFDYTDRLAHVLAAAVQLIDPDAVVMGGGVCAMRGFPRAALEARLKELCMKPVPANTLRLVYPPECEAPGVYGAAVYARRQAARKG